MLVEFENGSVPIWKLRKGIVLKQEYGYYHLQNFYFNNFDEFTLVLENEYEVDFHVTPDLVTWVEPF